MQWDNDFDVKEYHPKKRGGVKGPENAIFSFDTAKGRYGIPGADTDTCGGIADRNGGVMMTASEILDFAEGTDPIKYS